MSARDEAAREAALRVFAFDAQCGFTCYRCEAFRTGWNGDELAPELIPTLASGFHTAGHFARLDFERQRADVHAQAKEARP